MHCSSKPLASLAASGLVAAILGTACARPPPARYEPFVEMLTGVGYSGIHILSMRASAADEDRDYNADIEIIVSSTSLDGAQQAERVVHTLPRAPVRVWLNDVNRDGRADLLYLMHMNADDDGDFRTDYGLFMSPGTGDMEHMFKPAVLLHRYGQAPLQG